MKYILAVLLYLSIPSSALAYEKAEELLWACTADRTESPEKAFEKMHCIGYVTGILDGIQLVFGIRPESKFFCPPAGGMSVDQQIHIVTKWLEDNPKELHKGARMLVLIAYAKAFPCS
jgi:hypothetical protein